MIPQRLVVTLEQCIKDFFVDTIGSSATLNTIREISATSGNAVVGFLGYADLNVKGSLVIVSRPETLKASHPMTALGADVSEADQLDWLGEMANQVLGRLKNGMLPFGLSLNLATPSIVQGSDLRLASTDGSESILRAARTESGLTFGFALNVAFASGFDPTSIDRVEPSNKLAKKEGEGFVF